MANQQMRHKFEVGDKVRHIPGKEWGYPSELKEAHDKKGFLTINKVEESSSRPGEPCYGFAEDTMYPDRANWLYVDVRFILTDKEWVKEWQ